MRSAPAAFLVFLALLGSVTAARGEPNPHNSAKCLLCHLETPRFGVDTRETVRFRGGRAAEDPLLCSFCHDPEENLHPMLVEPGPDLLGTRKPSLLPLGEEGPLEGKVVCITCHFYHAAERDHALLRGFAGSQKPAFFNGWQDFCRDCHGEGLEKRSPHSGDERACVFCHQSVPREGQAVEVAPRGAGLCNFCHGSLQDRHFSRLNPFDEPVSCTVCHGPHLGPESIARLKPAYLSAAREAFTIDPHGRRGLCVTCHLDEEGLPLRSDDPVELCNRCHGHAEVVSDIHPLGEVSDRESFPEGWPLADGSLTCLTCHLPGHPEERGISKLLRGGPYGDLGEACHGCHDFQAMKGVNPHRGTAAEGGCELCHPPSAPGSSADAEVRLIADPNLLCLRCHPSRPHPGEKDHTLTLSSERARAIAGDFPLHRERRMVCSTCHDPHREGGELLTRRSATGSTVCGGCHRP